MKNRQEYMDYLTNMLEDRYPSTPHRQTMYVYNNPQPLFTPEECDQIVHLGRAQPLEEQTNQYKNTADFHMKVAYIPTGPETEHVYQRLWSVVDVMNQRYWKFNLYDFAEPLKFAEYRENNGTSLHTDNNMHDSIYRKLTVIVQLSEEMDYMGGQVEVHNTKYPLRLFNGRGCVAVFPSYILHKVEPILCGVRNSLVAFVHGPPFC